MADAPRDPGTTDGSASTREPEPSTHSRPQIGPYRLLQRVGEGGMGEVWLAEQTSPVRRQVAFKVIKAGMDTAQVIARFEAERQALALMDHSAIATVFDGGTTPEGRPYFVMEYVKGEPITTYCDRQRLTIAARLELFTHVCEGVQHAHQKGIIHRDLKPTNVLVAIQDGHPVPKIIDFGLAKATAQPLTERTLFTELGVMVGTPEYMSPEQAEMGGLNVDTRTDVYALGVMLYELLTGALPFDREELRRAGFLEIQRTIREKEPPRPSTRIGPTGPASTEAAKKRHTEPKRLVSELRGDLDWITMKALEKDRTRRYASASDIAADIQRHLADQPVLAGPPSVAYRTRKFVHRHRAPLAAAVAVVLALVVGLIATSVMYVQADRASARAEEARRRATWQAYLANLQAADSSLRMNEHIEAKRRLEACDPGLRNWEWRYLSGEAAGVSVVEAPEYRAQALSDPDGSYILGRRRGEPWLEGAVFGWEPKSGALVRRSAPGDSIVAVDSVGGHVLADQAGGLRILGLAHDRGIESKPTLSATETIFNPMFSPDGKFLVGLAAGDGRAPVLTQRSSSGTVTTVRGDRAIFAGHSRMFFLKQLGAVGRVAIWRVPSGEQIARLPMAGILPLAIAPDSTRLLTLSVDGTVNIWRLAGQMAVVATLAGQDAAVQAARFSRDGARVATASWDKGVRIWDASSGRLVETLGDDVGPMLSVAFSPDGTRIAAGSGNGGTVRVWSAGTELQPRVLAVAGDGLSDVPSVAFTADGERIMAVTGDKVCIWRTPVHEVLEDILNSAAMTWDLQQSADGNVVATVEGATGPTVATTWDARTGQQLASTAGHVMAIALSEDGSLVAVGIDGTVQLRDARSGGLVATFPGFAGDTMASLAMRPRSRQVAMVGQANNVEVWEVGARHALTLTGHSGTVDAVSYDPGGSVIATHSEAGELRLWDADSGRLLRVVEDRMSEVSGIAFSRDGRWVALSSTREGTARVWKTSTGAPGVTLLGHASEWIASVAFSPDATRIVTAARDQTVRIWDSTTGDQLLVLRYATGSPQGAAFTPDGKSVVSWQGLSRVERGHVWTAK